MNAPVTSPPRAMPALVTPFDRDEAIDLDAHRSNITAMSERGARGVVLAGSTGEGPYLDRGERAALVQVAADEQPEMTLVCGIQAETTRDATRQTAECEHADLVLVVTPTTLVRGRVGAVEQFYLDVADQSPVPVLLYSVPSVTAWELPTASVRRLATHDNIVGMKDSGGDPTRIAELHDVIDDGFFMYAGASQALAESSRAGAWGAITASGNYAIADVSLAARGDDQAQRRLGELAGIVERHGIAGTKYAAHVSGLDAGIARRPVMPLAKSAREEIATAVRAAGLASSQ